MNVDIPEDLAARVRQYRNLQRERSTESAVICADLAALLPEPDPLDVLAQEDGWEAHEGVVRWAFNDDVHVQVWPLGVEVFGYNDTRAEFPSFAAAAVRLARRLRHAIEQEEGAVSS